MIGPLQQAAAGTDLILVELFLFVITGAASYMAYRTRQIWHKIDSLTEQVDTNSRILVGEEGEPYDGIIPEVKENSARLQQHKELLKRLRRAMQREGHIAEDDAFDLETEYEHEDRFGGDD